MFSMDPASRISSKVVVVSAARVAADMCWYALCDVWDSTSMSYASSTSKHGEFMLIGSLGVFVITLFLTSSGITIGTGVIGLDA